MENTTWSLIIYYFQRQNLPNISAVGISLMADELYRKGIFTFIYIITDLFAHTNDHYYL